MPLNKTPPVNDSPVSAFKTPLAHYASDPNLANSPVAVQDHGMSAASSLCNIPTRLIKRKREELSRPEILDLFSQLRNEQDTKFSAILSSLNDVKVAINTLSNKHDEVLKRLDTLEEEKKSSDNKIQFLENKIELLERQARCTSVEIRNIPQATKESKEALKTILIQTAEALNVPLDSAEIKDVYRLGTNTTTKPIIADFTTVFTRDKFLRSFKDFNKAHQEARLSTGCLSTTSDSGPNKPIYISENLTPKERKLYFLAREFKKNSDYNFCWTSFGKILLRQSEGSPFVRITCESDLEKLKNNQMQH